MRQLFSFIDQRDLTNLIFVRKVSVQINFETLTIYTFKNQNFQAHLMIKELQLDTDAYVAQYVNQSEKYAVRQRHWRLRTEEALRAYGKIGARFWFEISRK